MIKWKINGRFKLPLKKRTEDMTFFNFCLIKVSFNGF